MAEPKRFNEREVAEIVRIASQGKSGSSRSSASEGLTLDEIQAVVTELGLDPASVAAAAAQVEGGLPEEHVNGSQVEFLRTFEGELDDAGWEEILLLMRRKSGAAGEVSVRGSTREWTNSGGGLETYHLSATVKEGRTRIRITQDVSGIVFMTWLLSIIPMLFGPVVIISKSLKGGADMTWPLIISAAITFAVFFGASTISRRQKKRAQQLGSILEEFEPFIRPQASAVMDEGQAAEEEVRLRLGQAD